MEIMGGYLMKDKFDCLSDPVAFLLVVNRSWFRHTEHRIFGLESYHCINSN